MDYYQESREAKAKYKYKEGDLVRIPDPHLLGTNSACVYGQSSEQVLKLTFKIDKISSETCTLRAIDPKTKEELHITSNNILYHHLKKIPTVEIKI